MNYFSVRLLLADVCVGDYIFRLAEKYGNSYMIRPFNVFRVVRLVSHTKTAVLNGESQFITSEPEHIKVCY